jgi:hypothetical protein
LTCTIGTSNPFARSLEYRVERPSLGSVVNPTWLFAIRCKRPARRVPVEAVEVERLGDHPLAGERGIAVDEDGQRDRRIVDARAGRAIGLLGAREPFDDGVHGLEMARIRGDRDLDLARGGHARLGRRQVVLDVARATLRGPQ